MDNISFIFIGGTYRGYKLLETLLNLNYIPEYVVILKDDDHEVVKYTPKMSLLVESKGIKFSIKKKLNQEDFEFINSSIWDFALICGWRTIIPFELDQQFKYGLLAAHDSLLPKYRGFAPLNWAIINGETQTGVTLFRINENEVDSGDIYLQESVDIEFNETINDIYLKIVNATISICIRFIDSCIKNEVFFYKQIEDDATYTCKRSPQDGKIDWNKSSIEIYNLIRALCHPYPGAFCTFENEIYHIREAKLGKNNSKKYAGIIPGKVISIGEDFIEIMCGQGTLNVSIWENKRLFTVESPSVKVKSITSVIENGIDFTLKKNKIKLFIFPLNGNGLEAIDCLDDRFEFLGFIDDTIEKQGQNEFGFTVYDREILKFHQDAQVLCVPGSSISYLTRSELISNFESQNFTTIIHPSASISPYAKIGKNVLIMSGVVITSNAIIEDHVCIFPNTVIHHDSKVGEYTLIGSNVTLAGSSIIGKNCYIGSGTNIINNSSIGDYTLVGLGTNVIRAIEPKSKIVGNPSKYLID